MVQNESLNDSLSQSGSVASNDSALRENAAEPALTLASLIAAVQSCPTRSKAWRTCMASRLRTFARVVGVPPGVILANVPALRRTIAMASPGGAGIKPYYWTQIVGAVWRSLACAGHPVLRGLDSELPAEWQRLLNLVPARPDCLAMTPMVRTAVSLGLVPCDLDRGGMGRIRDAMQKSYTRSDYARAYRRGVRAWKKGQIEWPGVWPQHPVDVEYRCNGYTLPWSAFPELELETDRMLGEQAVPRLRRHKRIRPLRRAVARQRKYSILRAARTIGVKIARR